MDHRSRKEHRDKKASRKRRRSSSGSSSISSSSSLSNDRAEKRRKDKPIKILHDVVIKLPNRPPSGTSQQLLRVDIRQGDEELVPVFDPSEDDADVERWTKQVDGIAEQFEWDGRAILRLIVTRLKGHAKQWYDTRHEVTSTWSEVKEALIQQFRKTIPFAKLIKEAVLYETTSGQELRDYCLQKLDKIRKLKLPISDEHIIDMIIDGIKH